MSPSDQMVDLGAAQRKKPDGTLVPHGKPLTARKNACRAASGAGALSREFHDGVHRGEAKWTLIDLRTHLILPVDRLSGPPPVE